jgi:hypothetical protein
VGSASFPNSTAAGAIPNQIVPRIRSNRGITKIDEGTVSQARSSISLFERLIGFLKRAPLSGADADGRSRCEEDGKCRKSGQTLGLAKQPIPAILKRS